MPVRNAPARPIASRPCSGSPPAASTAAAGELAPGEARRARDRRRGPSAREGSRRRRDTCEPAPSRPGWPTPHRSRRQPARPQPARAGRQPLGRRHRRGEAGLHVAVPRPMHAPAAHTRREQRRGRRPRRRCARTASASGRRPLPRRVPTTLGRPGAASHRSTSRPAAASRAAIMRRHRSLARTAGLERRVGRVGGDQAGQKLRLRRSYPRSARAAHDRARSRRRIRRGGPASPSSRRQQASPGARCPVLQPAARRRSEGGRRASSTRDRRTRPAPLAGDRRPSSRAASSVPMVMKLLAREERGRPVPALSSAGLPHGPSAWRGARRSRPAAGRQGYRRRPAARR